MSEPAANDSARKLADQICEIRAASLQAAFTRLRYHSTLADVAELVRLGHSNRRIFGKIENRQPAHIKFLMLYRQTRRLFRRSKRTA